MEHQTSKERTDRCLTDNELDSVNGGIYHLAGAAALLTAGAMAAGEMYLNYKTKWYATR
jgi:lactobin A/cerein 7B family class IIb bacteriocin